MYYWMKIVTDQNWLLIIKNFNIDYDSQLSIDHNWLLIR